MRPEVKLGSVLLVLVAVGLLLTVVSGGTAAQPADAEENVTESDAADVEENATEGDDPRTKEIMFVADRQGSGGTRPAGQQPASDDIIAWREYTVQQNPDFIFDIGDLVERANPDWVDSYHANNSRIVENTDVERIWYGTGNHDGIHAERADLPYGWDGVEGFYRKGNRTSLNYAVEKGNTAFVMLSPLYYNDFEDDDKDYHFSYPSGDDRAPANEFHTLTDRTRQWFTERMNHYCSNDYNIVVMSHTPLYDSNIASSDWYDVQNKAWRNSTEYVLDTYRETCSPALHLNGHQHANTYDYLPNLENDEDTTNGGSVVWGASDPRLPDGTIYGMVPAIWIDHGIGANEPAVRMMNLTEGATSATMRTINVENGEQIPSTYNDSPDTIQEFTVPFDHPVDLGEDAESNEIDRFEQPWAVSHYSNESKNVQWWKPTKGLYHEKSGWVHMRWRFNEKRGFQGFDLDAIKQPSRNFVDVSTEFASGDSYAELANAEWHDDIADVEDAKYLKANVSFRMAPLDDSNITITDVDVESDAPAAEFEVSDLSAPANAVQGETVTVSATVTNVGGAEGSALAEFVFDEAVLLNESVTLGPGNSTEVRFEVPTDGVAAGSYTHGVRIGNSSETAEITLESSSTPEATDTPTEATDTPTGTTTDTGGQPGFGIVIAVAALLVTITIARRQNRPS